MYPKTFWLRRDAGKRLCARLLTKEGASFTTTLVAQRAARFYRSISSAAFRLP